MSDHRLGQRQSRVEARFEGQPARTIGPQQLDHVEGGPAVPSSCSLEECSVSVQVHGREHTAQVVVEETDERNPERNVDSGTDLLEHQVHQALDGHRGQSEDSDLREPEGRRHADRIGVPGSRGMGFVVRGNRLERPSRGFDHPLDLVGMGNVEIGKIVAASHTTSVPQGAGSSAVDGRYRTGDDRNREGDFAMTFLLRPRWMAFHALCLVAVVVMVNLSLWQFRRLDERQAFNELVRSRSTQTVIPIEELDLSDPPGAAWKRVGAVGTYMGDDSVLILNRSQEGRAGVNVVTPLRLTDGRIVIVVRGFLSLDEGPPAPPSGTVRVVGTVRTSETRRAGQPTERPEETDEFFRLDIERLAGQIDGQVLPVAISLEISDPPDSAIVQPVAAPELSDGPHLSYAIQWLIFATAVVVGWVLAVRRSYLTRSR